MVASHRHGWPSSEHDLSFANTYWLGRPNANGSDELAAEGKREKKEKKERKTCLFSAQCHETEDCETDDEGIIIIS